MIDTADFWEARAKQYASEGEGLKAVCSFAMPSVYNWSIDITQRHALREVLGSVKPGMRVLDIGCGIGRWSRELARRGATVTGVDFSESMLQEARRRTRDAGLGELCEFRRADVTELEGAGEFDLILAVTVLQHVLDDARLAQALGGIAKCLALQGRLVLLEAAPSGSDNRADTATFRARPLSKYLATMQTMGMSIHSVHGVDPAPFKLWVVPRFRHWPRFIGIPALTLAALFALPVDWLLAAALTRYSWHKIMITTARGTTP